MPRSAVTVAVSGALLGLLYGYDQSNVSSAQLFYQKSLHISTGENESITTAVPYGILVGCLLGGFFSNRFGRKKTTLAVVVGYMVFCLAQACAVDFGTLFAARLLLGFTIGVSLIAVPIFIAESVATRRRGTALVGYQVAEVFGIIVAFAIALALVNVNYHSNWRLMFGLAALPAIVLVPLVLRLPETARWLMLKGRREEAAAVMRRIDPDSDADEILDEIAAVMARESGGRFSQMLRPPFRRATWFLIVLGLLIQLTGINATITYGPAIAKNIGFHDNAAIGFNMIVQAFAFLAVLVSMKYVDNWGRRPILIGGFSGMLAGTVLVTIASYHAVDGGWTPTQKAIGFIGFIVMNMAFAFGIGGLVWAFASESLPSPLRAYGAVVLLSADLVANIIITQFYLSAAKAITDSGVFAIFAGIAVIAIFFVTKFAPETKGRDVDEIAQFWGNGGKWPERTGTVPRQRTSEEPAAGGDRSTEEVPTR